jgi:hypothetical protein
VSILGLGGAQAAGSKDDGKSSKRYGSGYHRQRHGFDVQGI